MTAQEQFDLKVSAAGKALAQLVLRRRREKATRDVAMKELPKRGKSPILAIT